MLYVHFSNIHKGQGKYMSEKKSINERDNALFEAGISMEHYTISSVVHL
jgi:hypothetical protein